MQCPGHQISISWEWQRPFISITELMKYNSNQQMLDQRLHCILTDLTEVSPTTNTPADGATKSALQKDEQCIEAGFSNSSE